MLKYYQFKNNKKYDGVTITILIKQMDDYSLPILGVGFTLKSRDDKENMNKAVKIARYRAKSAINWGSIIFPLPKGKKRKKEALTKIMDVLAKIIEDNSGYYAGFLGQMNVEFDRENEKIKKIDEDENERSVA